MNSAYRLVWNESAGTWVAVSELARGRTKRAGRAIVAAAALLAWNGFATAQSAPPPSALPTGGAITAGSGTIARNGNTLTVRQGSDRLVTNWSTFNIGSGATVRFVQPGASSVALNRIADTQPSQIFGNLTANGQVFLLNPAGIVFGRTARVDVGALVASSLALSDDSFLSGKYRFTQGNGAGAVVNEGTIRANGGVVALIAPQVRNSGTITATGGSVAMAAGDKVALDFIGNGLIRLNVDKAAFDVLVENHGLIQADGGMVVMSAKTANALMATVVNNTGTIEARTLESRGGRIMLLGDMEHGITQVGGTLDASAPNGGDGGFIETSGAKVKVSGSAVVTTAAPQGKAGNWLLDPTDIVVAATGDVAPATIDASASTVTLQASHDVTFNEAVAMTNAGAGLTVQAGNNVNVNAAISTNGGAINLSANDSSGPASGTGAVVLNAALTSNGGAIAVTGAGVSTAAPVSAAGGNVYIGGTSAGVSIGANVGTAGSGGITVAGTSTAGANAGVGVSVGAGASVSSSFGNISITGQGSTGPGVRGATGSAIASTGGGLSITSQGGTGVSIASSLQGGNNGFNLVTQGGGTSTVSGTIASGSGITVDDGAGAVTISGAIGGGADFNKNGSGTVILSGPNAYGGATYVNAGTLSAGGVSALPATTSATVYAGAALDLGASQTINMLELQGTLSGSGTLATNFSTNLRNGSLVTGNIGAGYVNVTGTVTLNGTVNANQISVNGGNLVLGSPGRISASTIVQDYGTITLGGAENFGTFFGTGTVNLGANTLTLGASGSSWEFDGVLAGAGQVAIAPGSSIYLGGNSTFSGGTSVGAGAYFVANSNGAAGTGTINVGTGALQVNGVTLGNAVTVAGGTISASGAGVINGAVTAAGATTLQPYGPGDSLTLNGPVGGSGAVTKMGQGPVTLTGANSWSGGTTVSQGTLALRDTVMPAGNVTINPFTTLEFDDTLGAARQLQAGTYSGGGTVRFTGAAGSSYGMGGSGTVSMALSQGGLVDLGGLVTFSGSLSGQGNWASNQGSLAIGSGATFDSVEGVVRVDGLTGSGVLQGGYGGAGSVTVGVANASSTFNGVVQDSTVGGGSPSRILNLAKTGFGTFTLAGPANTFTGTLDVQQGLLQATSAGALGATTTAATVHSGATLDLAFTGSTGKSVTLSGGTLGTSAGSATTSLGAVTVNSSASTLQASSGSTLQIASITDTGVGVLFSGPGNFDASGTNNLGTIAGWGIGNLVVQNGGGSALTVGNVGGTYGLNSSGNVTLKSSASGITLSNPLIAAGTAQLDAGAGVVSQAAGAGITAGTLVLTSSGSGSISLTSSFNSAGVLAGSVAGGAFNYVNGGALSIGVGNGITGITASGPISVATTSGNLTVAQNVASADTSSAAVVLTAGSSSGPASGLTSNVVLSGSPTITTGAGGTATLYTGSLSGSTGVDSLVGVGSGHFRYGSSQSTTNYSSALGSGLDAVYREQPTVTVTAANGSAVYGTTFVGSASVSGGLNGDTDASIFSGPVVVGGAVSTSGFAVVGTHALTPSTGTSSLGYALAATQGSLTVTAAPLSVSSVTAQNKVYDGTTGTAITGVSFGGLVAGDSVGLGGGVAAFSDKNVGAGKSVSVSSLAITGADAANYVLTSSTAATTANITARQITAVSGITGNKVYDGTTSDPLVTAGAVLSNQVAGDVLTLASATGTFADKNVATNKTVSITGLSLGGADAGNYTLASTTSTTTANITPATVTIGGITAADKVYDATTAATLSTAAATFTGKVAADSLTVASATGNFSDRNAATGKTVSISGLSLGGADAGNYILSSIAPTASASITPRPLTFNVTAADKTYDGSIGTFSNQVQISFNNLVPGDAWQYIYTGARYSDKNVGNGKTLTVSGIAFTGVNAGNYTIPGSTATTTSSILPRQITAVTGITASDKVYDGTTTAALLTGAAGFTNAVATDNLVVSAATGAFSDKNVGTGKSVGISGITLGGTDAGNYTLAGTTATASASITPASLAIAGITAANKIYDATTAATLAGTASVTALGGDVVSLSGAGSGTFADKNVGTGKVVAIGGYTLTGADAGNYVLQSASARADITPANLAIAGVTAQNKVYDGSTVAPLGGRPSVTPLGQDVVGVIAGTGTFADAALGDAKAVTVLGYAFTGPDGGNYTPVQPTGLQANITSAIVPPTVLSAVVGSSNLPKVVSAANVAPPTTTQPAQLITTADPPAPEESSTGTSTATPDAIANTGSQEAGTASANVASAPVAAPVPAAPETVAPVPAATVAVAPMSSAAATGPARAAAAALQAASPRAATAGATGARVPVAVARPPVVAFPAFKIAPAIARFGAAVPDPVGRKNPLLAESKVLPREPEKDFRMTAHDDMAQSYDSVPSASNASARPQKPRAVTLYSETLEALNFLNLLTLKILP